MATNYESVFGKKPIIPDLEEAQRQAILANIGNFGDLSALGGMTTGANQQQLLDQLMKTDPLFQQRAALQGADIMAQLEGRLPDAAKRYLQQVASERNVGAGVQGSPFGYNAEMGLTRDAVLGQIQQGITNANAFRTNMASTSTVPGYDVSKGFLSPEDQAQRNLLAANTAGAPDPAVRGKYEEDLAREFFNRTQAAGQPKQPTGGGSSTSKPTGPTPNSQYGAMDFTLSGSSPAAAPDNSFWRPKPQTGQFTSMATAGAPSFSGFVPSIGSYGATGPASTAQPNVLNSYQSPWAPQPSTTFTPMLDSLRNSSAGTVSPIFDLGAFRSPDVGGYSSQGPPEQSDFNFDFGQINYDAPAAQTADDWMNWLMSGDNF